ncbi:MAG: branched-chain amino acid aminotransferase, partial [Planctomycetota bacterium]
GLSEVSFNINKELEDVGSAFGRINQSFRYASVCGHKGNISGSRFRDRADFCDDECDITCDSGDVYGEYQKW